MKFKTKNTIAFKRVTKNTSTEEMISEIKELEEVDYSPLYNKNLPYHNYGYIHTFRVISDGLRLTTLKQFVAGLLAGIWIGLAYTAVSYATYTIKNDSVVKLLTGALFAGVILMIGFLGGGFLTAHMWYNRAMFKKIERWTVFLKACGLVYLGNIAGITIFVSILYLSNGFTAGHGLLMSKVYENFGLHKLYILGDKLGAKEAILVKDVFKSMGLVFASAILCNFLICLATQGAKSTKGNAGASMIMYLCVLFYFAIGGYQHSVANWYGAIVLIVMAIDGNPILLEGGQAFNAASGGWFILVNIIPAVLGNFLGGLIIGIVMSWFNKDFDDLLLKEARIKHLKEYIEERTGIKHLTKINDVKNEIKDHDK
ncbi:formate/nitrite transporter [Williamsoniiplasma somnilux]|uniref:Formate/nitrite transporter n=1 Tax=Williamsoniiplasma somnilux TaxID=215578 RepID=A0A2K8NXC7_9MOLU|nr:formate/nitrite transporter family protein [Williamsoniiplasma somnilux]ATZ18437.1 formate/nitrite transporter [Williamsoniiplasma somnilux]